MTSASPTNPTAQVTVIREDASAPLDPQVTVEVDDVDAVHAAACSAAIRSRKASRVCGPVVPTAVRIPVATDPLETRKPAPTTR